MSEIENKFKSYTLRYKDITGNDAKCGILLWHAYHTRKGVACAPAIVLMIELVDNHGRSVTNGGASIANEVMETENLPPMDTIFFEAYEHDIKGTGSKFRLRKDAIDLVEFDRFVNGVPYSNQRWKLFGMEKFKELLKNTFNVVFDEAYEDKISLDFIEKKLAK